MTSGLINEWESNWWCVRVCVADHGDCWNSYDPVHHSPHPQRAAGATVDVTHDLQVEGYPACHVRVSRSAFAHLAYSHLGEARGAHSERRHQWHQRRRSRRPCLRQKVRSLLLLLLLLVHARLCKMLERVFKEIWPMNWCPVNHWLMKWIDV